MTDGFNAGPLYVRFFGIIIMLGVLAGAWFGAWRAKQKNYDSEFLWDMLVNLMVGGIIGARLWHIFTPTNSSVQQGLTTSFYLTHPLDILAIWDGGLGIIGALFGGFIALWFYTRNNQLSFSEWLDILAPGLALGQAIGRFADYLNQQIYGMPTNIPWKIFINEQHRLSGYENQAYYHPLFAYEAILSIANLALLLWLEKQNKLRLGSGELFTIYILNYAVIRFLLEFFRLDVSLMAGFNINQAAAATIGTLAGVFVYMRHRQTP